MNAVVFIKKNKDQPPLYLGNKTESTLKRIVLCNTECLIQLNLALKGTSIYQITIYKGHLYIPNYYL